MLSISQLFELSPTTKHNLRQSGKLIGSGVALGLSGVGKAVDQTGQVLYKQLNKKESLLQSNTITSDSKTK